MLYVVKEIVICTAVGLSLALLFGYPLLTA